VQQQILDHTVELGMLAFRPDDSKLRSIVVYRDELAFVVHPKHPLARAKQVSIRQLGAESFVAHNVPSPYRLKVLQAFKRYKTQLNMDVELPTLEAIRKFVAMGNGVALLPGISVEAEVRRGELVHIPVRELKIERRLRIVYRKASSLSHAARALLKTAEAVSKDRGGPYLFQPEN
jgi:DNA-binding transcriptional LysR family regulator